MEFETLVQSRRSVRGFRNEPVPRAVGGAKVKRDIVSHGEYQGVHRTRQVDVAKKLFGAMGIARDDKPMRRTGCCAVSASSTHRWS